MVMRPPAEMFPVQDLIARGHPGLLHWSYTVFIDNVGLGRGLRGGPKTNLWNVSSESLSSPLGNTTLG